MSFVTQACAATAAPDAGLFGGAPTLAGKTGRKGR